jgi:hypothetical protein
MSEPDTVTADLRVFDIANAGSIVQKTDIITNKDDISSTNIFIDQRTNHVYVCHAGLSTGTQTWPGQTGFFAHVSKDNMTTWSADFLVGQYNQDFNIKQTFCPPMGACFMPAWMQDDFIGAYNVFVIPDERIDMPAYVFTPSYNNFPPGKVLS